MRRRKTAARTPECRHIDDDPVAQFQRTLQSRLLSGLADQVTQALFGENPKDSGRIVFGDLQVDFNPGVESIRIEIFDAAQNSNTVIEVLAVNVEPAR